ncbi:MAG: hypothetical protein ACTSYA_13480 [Candidatus Kariarchaeaceae archaeon]
MRKQKIEEWEEEFEDFSPGFFTKDHSYSASKHDLGTVMDKSDIAQIISNTKTSPWQILDSETKKYLRQLARVEEILDSWADHLPYSLRSEILTTYKRVLDSLSYRENQGYWTKKKALYTLLAILTHFHHQREVRTPISQLQLLAIKANCSPNIKPKDILFARKRLEELNIITHVVKTPLLAKTVFLELLNIRQKLNVFWSKELLNEAYALSHKAIERGFYLKTNPKTASLTVLGSILVILSSEGVKRVCEKLCKALPEITSLYDRPIDQLSRSIYRFRSNYRLSQISPEEFLARIEKQTSR